MIKGKDDAGKVLSRWLDFIVGLKRSSNDVVVLVAHYGLGFDFVLLCFEMLRHNLSWGRLKTSNIHFLDTMPYFKVRLEPVHSDRTSLSINVGFETL